MKCQNCGRELKNGARFCIACGAQHDANGQLIGGKQEKVDYNKTMMASNMNQANNSGIDYNKTMMAGSTGFKQYQPEQNQQNYQNYNYSNNNYNAEYDNSNNVSPKKKISPIIIICPIIIIGALAFSLFSGKSKKTVQQKENVTTEVKKETVIATPANLIEDNIKETIHLEGYWSADAQHFYINGEMQKKTWVEDYYVDENGDKVVSSWIDNKFYVDATGKKARNEWIEFTFYGEDGQKKVGFYYVDSDGLKVVNKTVDGRYLNDAGCYWPEYGEVVQNNEKKNEKIDEKVEKTSKNETTKQETTVAQTIVNQTTIPQTLAQQTIVQQAIIPSETNANIINTVASDGNIVGYHTTEQAFSDKKITKYVDIVIDDNVHSNLEVGVKEWSNNRDCTGFVSGEAIIGNNMTVTYDVKVERNDGKIFSLCETKTKYDTNKAYEKIRHGVTFDATSGQVIDISSIFNSEERFSEFSNKVLTKLKSNKSSIDEDVYEEILEGDPEDIYEYCTWYMSESGITIVFNSDTMGSSKVDGISFTLTYSESGNNINKLLLSKYRK